MVNKITLVIDRFQEFNCEIFKWLSVVIMLLIVFEVTMRYVFGSPTIWGMDVQLQFSAVQRMIAIGYTLLRRGHVRVDLVTVRLPVIKQRAMEVMGYIFFFFPLITALNLTMIKTTVESWQFAERSFSPWRYYVPPMKTLLVFGYTMLWIAGLSELMKDIKSIKLGSEEWIKDR
jgi:TRAP-type mannitol/chloroaromatic compound transport system permease small subunit